VNKNRDDKNFFSLGAWQNQAQAPAGRSSKSVTFRRFLFASSHTHAWVWDSSKWHKNDGAGLKFKWENQAKPRENHPHL